MSDLAEVGGNDRERALWSLFQLGRGVVLRDLAELGGCGGVREPGRELRRGVVLYALAELGGNGVGAPIPL